MLQDALPGRGWRLPWPDQIPWFASVTFAVLLFLGECMVGTDVRFAGLVLGFVVLSTLAVNLAGGMRSLGGFCIAVLALKTVIISQVAKVVLGEAAESHLHAPLHTMGAMTVGMVGVATAAAVVRVLPPTRHVLGRVTDVESLRVGSWILLVLAAVALVGGRVGGFGGLSSVMRQLSFTAELAIAFSTACVIRTSGGARLLGWLNGIPFGVLLLYGLGTSSRLRMLLPFMTVFLTAVAYGFRFRATHLLGAVVAAVLAFGFIIPVGQVARVQVRGEKGGALKYAKAHLTSWEGIRDVYLRFDEFEEHTADWSYYDEPNTLLDRLSLVKSTDELVQGTLQGGLSKWETTWQGVEMAVPKVLLPERSVINTGTFLGHKAGLLAEDDMGTQVAFSVFGDSFSAWGWAGSLWIPMVVCGLFLAVYRKLVAPLVANPWCVALMAYLQHAFAEESIAGLTLISLRGSLLWLGVFVLVSVAARAWRVLQATYWDRTCEFSEATHLACASHKPHGV